MEVHYDYDVNGYTVQALDDDGYIEDEYSATNNPPDSQGPIQPPDRAISLDKLRRWAIETALDFLESYDVDGDPIRDPTIRGGK